MPPQDKLDVLRYLDEFHYWHSLDDERICKRCEHTITGYQILVIELQGTRGKLHLKCPTAGCVATPGDWAYANPVQAAKLRADFPANVGKAGVETIASQRTYHGDLAAKRKLAGTTKRASISRGRLHSAPRSPGWSWSARSRQPCTPSGR
jgi:hypothetical protein